MYDNNTLWHFASVIGCQKGDGTQNSILSLPIYRIDQNSSGSSQSGTDKNPPISPIVVWDLNRPPVLVRPVYMLGHPVNTQSVDITLWNNDWISIIVMLLSYLG